MKNLSAEATLLQQHMTGYRGEGRKREAELALEVATYFNGITFGLTEAIKYEVGGLAYCYRLGLLTEAEALERLEQALGCEDAEGFL